MGLNLVKTVYNNEFRPTQDLPFLASCIGEVITIETEFFYENVLVLNVSAVGAVHNEDNAITFNPKKGEVDTLDTSNVMYTKNNVFFQNVEVGDIIKFEDLVEPLDDFAARTVTDILSSNAVKLSGAAFPENAHHETGYAANITLYKGLRLYYNLLANGSDFKSLIDDEIQQLTISSMDYTSATPQPLKYSGTKPYQLSDMDCYIIGLDGSANKQQRFKLVQKTRITPLFLLQQYDRLLLGQAPEDLFFGENCLKYINKIQISKTLNNTGSVINLIQNSVKSNTGWYGENFNGGHTDYVLNSLIIKRVSDLVIVPALQLGRDMQVEILISNTTLPFYTGNSKCIFGFDFLPDDETQYKENGRTQNVNFCIDSKICTAGSGFVNGNLFGTGSQIIKQVKCDKVGNDLKVTAIIRVGSDAEAIIRASTYQRYKFWTITENHALDDELSDKTALLCQVSRFYEQLTTIDLIDADTKFVQHAYSSYADGVDLLDAFPTDDISAHTNFSIDFTGHDGEGISIQTVRNRISLVHSTEAPIILEEFFSNTANYPVIGNQAQDLDFHQDRVFKVQEPEKKTISITRDFSADTGNVKYYKSTFPFMNRWEYWVKLLNISSAPVGIFDPTQPKNGLNNFWTRLSQQSGWSIEYELEFDIQQNGQLFSQTFTKSFISNDYDSNTDWTSNTIKTYDNDTNLELLFGGNKLLQGYKDTKVIATFTKTTGMLPALSDIAIVIWIETYEKGGINDIRRASSVYQNFNTFFKLPVTKSNTGNVYTGTSLFDFTKLPSAQKFTVYARIYELNGSAPDTFHIINEIPEVLTDGLGNRLIYAE